MQNPSEFLQKGNSQLCTSLFFIFHLQTSAKSVTIAILLLMLSDEQIIFETQLCCRTAARGNIPVRALVPVDQEFDQLKTPVLLSQFATESNP